MLKFKQVRGRCGACNKNSLNLVEAKDVSYHICDKCLIKFINEIIVTREDIVADLIFNNPQYRFENSLIEDGIREEFNNYLENEVIEEYKKLEDAYEELDDKQIELINERDLLEQKIAILDKRLEMIAPIEEEINFLTEDDIKDSLKNYIE